MKKIIALVLLLNLMAVNAAANSFVTYDRDTSIVNIKGSIEGKNKRITIEILKPKVTSNDLKNVSADRLSEYIYTARQIVTDGDGAFETEFKMEADTADYTVRINSDTTEEVTLKYVNSEEYKETLSKINSQAATADQILKVIEESYSSLGITPKYFEQLSSADKRAVAQDVLEYRNTLEQNVFGDYTELEKAYNTSVVIRSISTLNKNNIDGTDILDEYADLFGLKDTEVWDIFEQMEPLDKKAIASKLSSGKTINTPSDLRDGFVEYTILSKIQNAVTYSTVYDLINDNNDVLKVSFSGFNQLSETNKAIVMQKLIGQGYASAKELSKRLEEYVSEVKQNSTSDGGSSRSGGGSKNSSAAITIAVADPTAEQPAAEPFSDIASYGWAKDSIISLHSKGIVSGRGDGKFYPQEFVKREEFVKMLVSGLGLKQDKNDKNFADVDQDMWYAPYIVAAAEAGLVRGVEDNIFGVGKNVTRQDIAVFLYRAANYMNVELPENNKVNLNDKDKVSGYAVDAVSALCDAGIITGNENGNFAPEKSATRAETARLIAEFLKLVD